MDQIGKYEILDKIGSGGFAVVYKGYDPFIKRAVAIKVCFSRDAETRERFHREAEIAGRMVHRNVTAVYDFGLHEDMPYLVEEYLPGEDLAHMIRRREPESLDEKLDVLLQIASGLGYAHSRHVIHRDIKPSNIRILDSGRVKIMDFGTAKLVNVESNLTQTGMTLGTVAYLSPERLLGRASGTNSDIFSYGVLAYELLSFERPFSGRNIPALIDKVLNAAPVPLETSWPACPPSLAAVVHRCLIKDPGERYAACEQIIADLEEVRTEHGARIPEAAAEASTAVPGTDLRLSGLLEHARDLHGRSEHRRAEALLDEVLEMDPDHAAARRLRAACRRAAAGNDPATARDDPGPAESPQTQTLPTPTGAFSASRAADWETPDDRRRRKITEAVASIESYIEARQLTRAAEALRFATEFLGDFAEAAALRRRLAGALETDREAFDSGSPAARQVVATPRRDAGRGGGGRGTDADRRKKEAVDSIERLLSAGDAATAEEALRFAVSLFGEFEQIPRLQQRIRRALRDSREGT